ncbi:MAG: outer-membrane lipoprotein carrier protein LolA [Ottowia sp.]|nr:outer-membrane lipoprotein carrier protein LolA [Ottowia sp.]
MNQTISGAVRALVFAAAALGSVAAGAQDAKGANGALAVLDAFVRTSRCGEARFTQTVTSASQTGKIPRTTRQEGNFAFCRAGQQFRFDYEPPFEQSIVADGTTLWLHDKELNQVTAQKQAQALAGSPTSVVTTARSLKDLERDFELKAEEAREGLHWVRATPKSQDSTLSLLRVGLREGAEGQPPQLVMLDIEDRFGKRSTLRFEAYTSRDKLDAARFSFTTPKGATVLRPEE